MDDDAFLAAAIARVGEVATRLPETLEQDAWIGVRWRIRTRTFAHVAPVRDGWPAAHARAALGGAGPHAVLVFHADLDEVVTFEHLGPPWFKPPWSATVVGLVLGTGTDWDEVAEVVTDSYCLRAPKKLAALVERP
ncbi:MmcQ/YjbR family DNA-binding protein [Nocardioides sp. SYSU D00038]|uniref:MmcQ/YjbR family DNA-binding protein n=1 Tax=Nocardioides sp. SYSU D00038 TaxID=2812554 RepID=UPI0027DD63B9|nr:MmcQ/YjbR family DNA-binding protein [Nocardioides sp. SYSU D00038]